MVCPSRRSYRRGAGLLGGRGAGIQAGRGVAPRSGDRWPVEGGWTGRNSPNSPAYSRNSCDVPGLARAEPLPEGEQRQRLFDALARAILAAEGPILLIADDLQWFDRETVQFIHYLLRAAPDSPPRGRTPRREDFVSRHPMHGLIAGLQSLERCTEIELDRLTRAETAALAGRMAGQCARGGEARSASTPRPRATRSSWSRRCGPAGGPVQHGLAEPRCRP